MSEHKFSVGQEVAYLAHPLMGKIPRGTYKVTRLLPTDHGEPQYRVKHNVDGHERVVAESQLLPVRAKQEHAA
jgi:hypothetical protein